MASDKARERLAHRAANVRAEMANGVALVVKAGLELAGMRVQLADEFPAWCSQAVGIPLPEAELMIRWAGQRPEWSDPAAVALSDPLAGELLLLSTNRWARNQGMPPLTADE